MTRQEYLNAVEKLNELNIPIITEEEFLNLFDLK